MRAHFTTFTDSVLLRACGFLEWLDARRLESGRPAPAPDGLGPGKVLAGRYRLESIVGEGGMGRVWLARDLREERQVALKVQRTDRQPGRRGAAPEAAGYELALRHEFYAMTRLKHPGTVSVLDHGLLPDGGRFVVMEVVRGHDLSELVRRGPLRLSQVYTVLIELAHVMGFIHSRLIVHCDIKSDNVRVTSKGAVKLMDFGLMHPLGTPAGGMLKGSPLYMAPEVLRGGVIDGRTDLYSLGVLAFEMLSGRLPFTGHTLPEIAAQHLSRPAPDVRTLRDVPEALAAIVRRLLAKEPRERHQDAGELIEELGCACGRNVSVQGYGARASYLHCAELVGRDVEKQRLDAVLRQTLERRGRSVFVAAAAGVGKTRLLQEMGLAVKLLGLPFALGHCRAEGQAPLEPLADALGQLAAHSPPESLARHGPLLQHLVRVEDPPAVPASAPTPDRSSVFEALHGWLKELAERQPFVLCLEDLHWADVAMLEHLNVIVRELAGTPAMVLGSFRTSEVDRLSLLFHTIDDGSVELIELAPFSREHTGTLVQAMLRGLDIRDAFLDRLHAATGGNAFFITETMRAFIEQGRLRLVAGRWVLEAPPETLALPRTVGEVVSQRLSALPSPLLALCQRLSPLGRALDMALVKEVAALEEVELFAALDELVERQLLERVERRFYFTHHTVCEGVYASMSEAQRQPAHLAIAEAAERLYPVQVELLAYHFMRGGDRPRAIRYLLLATEVTRSRRMMLRTVELLTQAADLIESGDYPHQLATLVRLWSDIVELGVTAHQPSCIRYADKLFALWRSRMDLEAGVRQFHARSQRLLARPGVLGRRRLARLWADRPLVPASRDALATAPRFLVYRSLQALACASTGDARQEEIVAQQYADNPAPGPFRATAYTGGAIRLLHLGRWKELEAGARDALAWFDEHLAKVGVMPRALHRHHAISIHFLILSQAMTGRPLDEDVWQRGLALCERHDLRDTHWFLLASPAARAAILGDPAAMHERYERLVEMNRKLGHPQMQESRLAVWVAPYWLQRGEERFSISLLRKMESLARRLSQDVWLGRYAAAFRALYAVEHQGRAEAERVLAAALERAREVPSFRLAAQLLCARSRLELVHHPGLSRQSAEQALELATAEPTASLWDELVARQALAEAVGGEAGEQMAHESVELARRWGHVLREALGLFTLARLLAPRDRARAAAALVEAEEKLKALRCQELLAKVEAFRFKA